MPITLYNFETAEQERNAAVKKDIQTRKDIERLVQEFYAHVLKDELLAPVFEGRDIPAHLPVMYTFWSALLPDEQGYTGNAFDKHIPLGLTPSMFGRWPEIFETTVRNLFTGGKADLAISRAKSIAYIFENKLRSIGKLS